MIVMISKTLQVLRMGNTFDNHFIHSKSEAIKTQEKP